MTYPKIINVNTPNHSSKFMAKDWVKINDKSRGTYNPIVKLDLKLSC